MYEHLLFLSFIIFLNCEEKNVTKSKQKKKLQKQKKKIKKQQDRNRLTKESIMLKESRNV